MRRIVLLGLVAVLSCAVGNAQDKKPSFDPAKLVGDWKYASGKKFGEAVAKDNLEGTVTFTKDTVTLPGAPDMPFVMGYKIDTKANPATIDLTIKSGPIKEGKAYGIIALDGEVLKIAYTPEEANKRPTKFESTKDNGILYFTLKKTK